MRKKKISVRLSVVEKMPPLYHSLPGQEFDIFKSEVIKWLVSQPEILKYLFDKAKEYCVYDFDTGKWRGRDAR